LKRHYVLTPAADRDADEHFIFIAGRNRPAAERFFEALDATLTRLASMPELGERQDFHRPELARLRAWQVQGFENYIIFYRPIDRGIEVLRVLHAAQDIAAVLKND
jgi:toxin ParE1/3/4